MERKFLRFLYFFPLKLLIIKGLFEQGYILVIYQQQEIILMLTKKFSNLALTIFKQCVANGIGKFEIQNIAIFLSKITLVPTLIHLLLVVEYFRSWEKKYLKKYLKKC